MKRARILLLGFLILGACGSTYGMLKPEAEIPRMRALGESFDALDKPTARLETKEQGGPDVTLYLLECNPDKTREVIVFVHGVMSDRRTWRYVAGALGDGHTLWLLDLPGCGRSDKPDPGSVSEEFYAPTALARRVALALRERLKTAPPDTRLTVVGHSLGSMILVRLLGDLGIQADFPDVLERIDGAVLLTPVDVVMSLRDPDFEKMAAYPVFLVKIAQRTGILKESVAKAVWEGTAEPDKVPREEADRLIEILSDSETLKPGQAMIRLAVPLDKDGNLDWRRAENLEGVYANIRVPCLILWGARDKSFSKNMGYKVQALIPDAKLCVLAESMHSLPSTRP
ncbi:MAG: alpha/beta hydrolase, partial [Planctomycetota bacterium]|nr:alpha/beta hydrolase [Planctomycetota bacterium]